MTDLTAVPKERVAVLRCQTWHVWPPSTVLECPRFTINDTNVLHRARLAILAYQPRTEPAQYLNEDTGRGPLIWDGDTHGLYRIWDVVLKAPEDRIPISMQYRHAYRGEVDVCLNFFWDGDCDEACVEMLRTALFAIVAVLNVRLGDLLTPTAPLSVRQVLPDGDGALSTTTSTFVRNRRMLASEELQATLSRAVNVVQRIPERSKVETALELYQAHFTEQQGRIRFLLLVLAFEALAKPTPKHAIALALLDRWRTQLTDEISRYTPGSEEVQALEALVRELIFRKNDSIRSQVRKLFSNLPDATPERARELQRRALHVYDRRSTLVHEGHLPVAELPDLERQARELLEILIDAALKRAECRDDPASELETAPPPH